MNILHMMFGIAISICLLGLGIYIVAVAWGLIKAIRLADKANKEDDE